VFTTLGSGGGTGRRRQGGREEVLQGANVTGEKLNPSRRTVPAAGWEVKLVSKKSKRHKGIVLEQSRKAGKKLTDHAVVKLTIAVEHLPKATHGAARKKNWVAPVPLRENPRGGNP
jgi:beta-lactam-binding protein with PASTA domain